MLPKRKNKILVLERKVMKNKIFFFALVSFLRAQAQAMETPATQEQTKQIASNYFLESLGVRALQNLILDYLDESVNEEECRNNHSFDRDYSSDGQFYARIYLNTSIHISKKNNDTKEWDLNKILPHTGALIAVKFSPDGTYLAVGSFNNSIKIWHQDQDENKQWKCINSLEVHATARTFSFSSDNKYLASGFNDKAIKIWQQDNDNKWICIQTLEEHTDSIISVSFSADGKYLVSASFDKTIKIWQQDNNKWICMQTITDHSIKGSVVFSPSGKYLISCKSAKELAIWHLGYDKKWKSSRALNISFDAKKSEDSSISIKIRRNQKLEMIDASQDHEHEKEGKNKDKKDKL
jgi:WD40 repeat protein